MQGRCCVASVHVPYASNRILELTAPSAFGLASLLRTDPCE